MTLEDLPPNWVRAKLEDVAIWGSGGTPKAGDKRYYGGDIPWAVIGDLTDGVVTSTANSITSIGLENSSAKLVPEGTVLIAMYGSIGKLGIASRKLATNQAIAFAIPNQKILSSKYLFWYLRSQRDALTQQGKGATQQNISQTILRSWPILLPPPAEQQRITASIEYHLSRMEASVSRLDIALQRLDDLTKKIIISAVPIPGPRHWEVITTGEAGKIELGRQRHPAWHKGKNMRPYLRVANVFEDYIDTTSLMEMDFSPDAFEKFQLHPGDILLNEGQSPEYLGRPAMYRGDPPNVAFTNSLLRFQAKDGIDPEWALLVFRRHMHAGRFIREVRITTNIAHLSAGRLKSVEFPIPPIGEQKRIVADISARLFEVELMRSTIKSTLKHADKLRQSILKSAFTGRLTPQYPDDEPAAVMLERVRAEQAAASKTKRARRVRKSTTSKGAGVEGNLLS
ncbi:restriction endonuclease subunit S [Planomonospora algeriensis]